MTKKIAQIAGLTIEWLGHSTVSISDKKLIYIDPFSEVLKGDELKADFVISTHGHRDHFDVNAINKLSKDSTYVIIKSGCDTSNLLSTFIKELEVNEALTVSEIDIKGVHAYNIRRFKSPDTPFHPKGFGLGVVVTVGGVKLYYAGDTDFITPMERLRDEKIDVAFLPIGGKYTMDVEEVVEAVLAIEPRIVIPVHYNHIKGTEADAFEFREKVEKRSEARVIIL